MPAGGASGRAGSPPTAQYITTGEAARLCAVDPRTIARWTDAGIIPVHRTAGGRRRIVRSDLLEFMRGHGIPLPIRPEPPRIAIVDDDPQVVRALARALLRIVPGADCRTANDGFSAGVLLASFRPHLVLLDVVMPGMSGIEVCERIRATPSLADTAIVVISGHLTDKLRARLAAAGADRCLLKPCTRADVEAAIVDLVRARTSPAQVAAESR